MGLFDTVRVPCPKCRKFYRAQSKGAASPGLKIYSMFNCPLDVLSDVNRHAPFTCEGCGAVFSVQFVKTIVHVPIPTLSGDTIPDAALLEEPDGEPH